MEKRTFDFKGHRFLLVAEGSFLVRLSQTEEVFRDPSPFLLEVEKELLAYFEGKRKTFSFPYRLIGGTSFQKEVLKALGKIPYGERWTYARLAEHIGTKAIRAVGTALRKNPLPIVLPCHRVVRSDGDIGNYVFGKDFKAFLLEREGR